MGVMTQAVLSSQTPNIVLIILDDMGHGDLGFHGNPVVNTPVLDELAENSVRLTRFHVSPVCGPTRASLMTGKYSLRTGVYDTYRGGAVMAAEEVTLAEHLQRAGYRTGIVGKWHLGDAFPYRPGEQGFEYSLIHGGGGLEQPGDFFENFSKKAEERGYFDPWLHENGEKVQRMGYCTDVFTDAGIQFIERSDDRPFFLYVAYNAPHDPLQVPDAYLKKYPVGEYDLNQFPEGGSDEMDRMSEFDIEAAFKTYAMMENVDDNIGRLIDSLQRSGKLEDTLIIFTSDNGPQYRRYNSGLRGRKGSIFQGGIQVPSFWSFPGRFGADREVAQLSAHLDVVPTLLSLVDLPIPEDLDGISLLPVLEAVAENLDRAPLFFQWQRGYPRGFDNAAVIDGNWKLAGKYFFGKSPDDWELFNLSEDPLEQTDLKNTYPDKLRSMERAFRNWQDRMKASPSLQSPQPALIGADGVGPVRLNRNDWKGPHTEAWGSFKAYGYWDIQVVREGLFDVTLFFQESLPGDGWINLRIGSVDQQIRFRGGEQQTFTFEDVRLREGIFRLDAWYWCHRPDENRGVWGPFDVILSKH